MNNEFRMKRNCLNCKKCNEEDLTCKKDGEDIPFPFTQEMACCEMKESSLQSEKMMNLLCT